MSSCLQLNPILTMPFLLEIVTNNSKFHEFPGSIPYYFLVQLRHDQIRHAVFNLTPGLSNGYQNITTAIFISMREK